MYLNAYPQNFQPGDRLVSPDDMSEWPEVQQVLDRFDDPEFGPAIHVAMVGREEPWTFYTESQAQVWRPDVEPAPETTTPPAIPSGS